jgi:hypothetical protein
MSQLDGMRAWWQDRLFVLTATSRRFPVTRRLLLLPVAVAASGVLLSGCGGSGKSGATTNPPAQIVPSTQAPRVPATSAAPKRLPAAAAEVLQTFLRGIAADDPTVCKNVSAAYNKSKPGGCKKEVKTAFKHLKPKQVKELKAVEAVKGVPGAKKGQFTVLFSNLKWTKGTLPQGILADKYVLTKTKGKWLITA